MKGQRKSFKRFQKDLPDFVFIVYKMVFKMLCSIIHFGKPLKIHLKCKNLREALKTKFSVKIGNLAQPASPPLPECWNFFREFVENFRQNRVKYALKTVIYKSWDWVRPSPPPWDKIPTFTENLFWRLP